MEIDKQGLSKRGRIRDQQGCQGIDLWIIIDDVDREDACEIVRSLKTMDDGLAQASTVLPTSVGMTDSAAMGYWAHPTARGTGTTTSAALAVVAEAFAPAAGGGGGLPRAHVEGRR